MKISVYDNWLGKFTTPIIEHWRSLGHQVLFNPTNEDEAGSDINFFYQADNQTVELTEKFPLSGKTFVHCVDIEAWAGQATAVKWDKVHGAIFMAKHIQEMVNKSVYIPCPQKLIKPGIDLKKYTVSPLSKPGRPVRRIAYVVGDRRIWDVKRLDIAFQLLKDLLSIRPQYIWQLHIRGTYSTHEQYNAYCRYLEKDLGIKDFVVWYPDRIEDMNAWYDDKDYLIVPSTKEAFSYATGEAMAKGIKPVIGNWESSKDNWKPYVCETYFQMLEKFTEDKYEKEEYRKYVEEHFDQERYFRELDEFMGL